MPPAFFNVIYAVGPQGEFGNKGSLPWPKLSQDLAHFKKVTSKVDDEKKMNVLIMGRKTFESIGFKPLPGRINIVVSKLYLPKMEEGCELPFIPASSLDDALEKAGKMVEQKLAEKTFVIGGVRLIEESFQHPRLEHIYITRVVPLTNIRFEADTHLVQIDRPSTMTVKTTTESDTEANILLTFDKLKVLRKNPEYAYLDLCRDILERGTLKPDRTGVGTRSIWGGHMRVPLGKYPLYTTKDVFFRGVAEELLFFISGKTDTKILEAKNVNIWKGDTSRAKLDERGFPDYKEGEMGPGYGFQLRHWGATYVPNVQLEIGSGGFDQLAWLVDAIRKVKANPGDSLGRRLLISMWNPVDVPKCALPPCHHSFQFSVSENKLNCLVTMRSNDMGCGNPFNIASYALLTYMICHLVGLIPGELVLNMADCHIYLSHLEQIKEQLERPPREWPTLEIVGTPKTIDDFAWGSFKLSGYAPHPKIKAAMVC